MGKQERDKERVSDSSVDPKDQRYHPKGLFEDPVMRCDSCNKLNLVTRLSELGNCEHCGNKRVRAINQFNTEEREWMEEQGVDPEYLATFEEVA